jgi:hypothetical protein
MAKTNDTFCVPSNLKGLARITAAQMATKRPNKNRSTKMDMCRQKGCPVWQANPAQKTPQLLHSYGSRFPVLGSNVPGVVSRRPISAWHRSHNRSRRRRVQPPILARRHKALRRPLFRGHGPEPEAARLVPGARRHAEHLVIQRQGRRILPARSTRIHPDGGARSRGAGGWLAVVGVVDVPPR